MGRTEGKGEGGQGRREGARSGERRKEGGEAVDQLGSAWCRGTGSRCHHK